MWSQRSALNASSMCHVLGAFTPVLTALHLGSNHPRRNARYEQVLSLGPEAVWTNGGLVISEPQLPIADRLHPSSAMEG